MVKTFLKVLIPYTCVKKSLIVNAFIMNLRLTEPL